MGNDLQQLTPLCGKCHKDIEFDGKRKLTIAEANTKLRAKLFGKWKQIKANRKRKAQRRARLSRRCSC
jgi:hypothetical protein